MISQPLSSTLPLYVGVLAGGEVRSEGDAKVKASKSGDTWSVDVNDYEHYQIPEAVISGG